MKCPSCTAETRVTYSMDSDSASKPWLKAKAQEVFGWWSQDFRVRQRVCDSCLLKTATIEIPVNDLAASYQDLRKRMPDRHIKTEKLLDILETKKTPSEALSHILAVLFYGSDTFSS